MEEMMTEHFREKLRKKLLMPLNLKVWTEKKSAKIQVIWMTLYVDKQGRQVTLYITKNPSMNKINYNKTLNFSSDQ